MTIPPEVTPENVTTYIVDSSGDNLWIHCLHFLIYIPLAAPKDRAHLDSELRKAHVICVVYSIDNPNSFDRIPTYWLPYFRSLGVNVSRGSGHGDYCGLIMVNRSRASWLVIRLTCEVEKLRMRRWRKRLCQLCRSLRYSNTPQLVQGSPDITGG